MRAHFVSTQKAGNTFARLLVMTMAVASLGLLPQVASALSFTTWDIEDLGNEQWKIVGNVDVSEEEGEIAEISFGGVIEGATTSTDLYGDFELVFAASYGSDISFVGSTATQQTETQYHHLFDPSQE